MGIGSVIVVSIIVAIIAYLVHVYLMRTKKIGLLEFSEIQWNEARPLVNSVMHKAGEKWKEAQPILAAAVYKMGNTVHKTWQDAKPLLKVAIHKADDTVRTLGKEAKPVLTKVMQKGSLQMEEAYKVMSRRIQDAVNAVQDGKNQSVLYQELQIAKLAANRTHQEFFAEMDSDSSGGLSQDELAAVLREQGDYEDQPALTKLFKVMDKNRNGKISFDEADEANAQDETEIKARRIEDEKNAETLAKVCRIEASLLVFGAQITHEMLFAEMDKDSSGFLSQNELSDVLRENGDFVDKRSSKNLFKSMDTNRDGKLSLTEAEDYEKKSQP